jgi:hypothetical protein
MTQSESTVNAGNLDMPKRSHEEIPLSEKANVSWVKRPCLQSQPWEDEAQRS